MNQIQLFKIFICSLLFSFIFSLDIKPDNNKKLVKINIDGKNRTYYHLKKNDELVFTLSEKGIKDLKPKHSLKLVTRTLIASNSNSSKVFGIELSIYNNDILEETRSLMYDKVASNAFSDDKPGWNFTKAGFWFEELNDIENKTIKIKLMEGSTAVDLKLILDNISLRTSKKELLPITVNDEYIIKYKENPKDNKYKKSDNWYILIQDSPLQYKISGPKIIRFITRVNLDESNADNDYSFILREDGRFVSNYSYEANSSSSNAVVKNNSKAVSGYNSSFYNIPKGIHYYTFLSNNAIKDAIYLKLEEYESK